MKNSFIREKAIYCGKDFLTPEIFPYTGSQQEAARARRGPKLKVTAPKQKNLNDKRAKRYFVQLALANFGEDDIALHLTYAPEFLPKTPEEAQKIAVTYLRRVSYQQKKLGLAPLKYILVTEVGKRTHRIHHHILMNGALGRNEIEALWWKDKAAKDRPAVMYGWANARRIQPNKAGITALARYLAKASAGKKHWTQSQNLDKPYHYGPNDQKYTRRQLERVAKLPEDSEEYRRFWERQYRGWELVDSQRQFEEQAGWYFYLTMRRRN